MQQIIRAHSPSSSLISSPSSAGASSTLQEGDGVRKSGPIVLLNSNNSKKKGQSMYAVLSERALELHESEKAQRKKKGTKSIVDLSKCFNVSQQVSDQSREWWAIRRAGNFEKSIGEMGNACPHRGPTLIRKLITSN
ncbi:hypothetical protein niasHT_031497 [Heterodera trifolii]|uniref:Uncharacterized protein n=1 Tax=Heterodera trifolii TaxID=157864 RepID=A0ABD2IQM8_9BILA